MLSHAEGASTWQHRVWRAWALAGLIWQLSQDSLTARSVLGASTFAFLAGSMLVLIGTRGRHPGWVALGTAGILTWVGFGAA